MSKIEESIKPVFKVDRVYNKGQTNVSAYVIALRVGGWTEEEHITVGGGMFSTNIDLKKLRGEIQAAKRRLLEKYQLFADEFPEVEEFGKAHIEASIRRSLDMPALPDGGHSGALEGEVVS